MSRVVTQHTSMDVKGTRIRVGFAEQLVQSVWSCGHSTRKKLMQ